MFIPKHESSGHDAVPRKDTFEKEDGSPADIMLSQDYPVTATCDTCSRPIRLAHKLQYEWRHVPSVAGSAP